MMLILANKLEVLRKSIGYTYIIEIFSKNDKFLSVN